MTMKKPATRTTKAAAPARRKLTVKKDALKDLSAVPAGKAAAVKGGTYSIVSRR